MNAEYVRCIDTDALEAWPDFFLETGCYKITTAKNIEKGMEAGIIYADSRGMLADRVNALRNANIYERQRYRHVVGLPHVLSIDEEVCTSETPFLVIRIMGDGQTDVFASGEYRDTIVEEQGDLRFRERIVICDSTRFDTLVAIPL